MTYKNKIALKVCGMKHNTAQVGALEPDYLGFIFYDKSQRNFIEIIPPLPKAIKRVGVFVNASIDFILDKIKNHGLDIIQLHGEESPDYCSILRKQIVNVIETDVLGAVKASAMSRIEVWKVFSVGTDFDFSVVVIYENIVDAFLFDTKGAEKGGNGIAFDWGILKNYPSQKPFILSGGISLKNTSEIKNILATNLPLVAIDVNSKFEIKPGLKDISSLKKLIKTLKA